MTLLVRRSLLIHPVLQHIEEKTAFSHRSDESLIDLSDVATAQNVLLQQIVGLFGFAAHNDCRWPRHFQ